MAYHHPTTACSNQVLLAKICGQMWGESRYNLGAEYWKKRSKKDSDNSQLANPRVHVRVLFPQTEVIVNATESRATAKTCTPAHPLAAALVLRAALAVQPPHSALQFTPLLPARLQLWAIILAANPPRPNWQTKGQRMTNWCLNQSAHPVHTKRSTNASTVVHPCQEKAEICSSKTTRPCVSSIVVRMQNGNEGNSDEGRTRILRLQKEKRSAAEEEGNFGGGFDYDCE
ncbi:hypothetical protein FA15DRAFT_740399 [Coprinopsis marcescibilis]|uniref:Uncharacterized protein n=1 Tax=Coprinopsis marcescibilis TaxID=230819 RepID=A0A5C3KVS8_COPMA|nr:hypothetical protein FA15DRAFT_740399 [Coprinopsis marcescibilis]